MAQVVVRVLASADPSLRTVIESFAKTSKRASDVVARDAGRVAKERVKTEGQLTKELEREEQKRTKAALKESQKREKDAITSARRQTQAFQREEKARVRERERYRRETERDNRQIVRDTMSGYNRITTVAGNAFGNMTRVAKSAVGVVTGFAGAIGVDTSFSSIARRGMDFEKSIVEVTNSGTKGVASQDDIGRTRDAVQGAAGKTFIDQNAMADALGRYVALTGELDSGIASLEMFGKLARATGSDVGDLAGAAGQISNGLGDVPDKAKLIAETLRVVAEQGRLGSVEIKELAGHMGKFASKAQFYDGTRQNAIASLGALAQIAMKGGGFGGADAALAAGNFNSEITSKSADKSFKKYNINRFAKNGQLRDAGDIVLDAIKATDGNGQKLQELFSQKASRKAAVGLAGIFNAAGKGDAGMAAARKELEKYRAAMSEEEVEGRAQNSMNTREGRSTDLNNRIQQKVGAMIDGLMPAFERLIPVAESLANSLIKAAPSLAKFAETLVDHPGLAITGAIVGSIAKAGLGEAVKGSLNKLLEGLFGYFRKPGAGGGGAAGAPATPGTGGSNAGSVLAVGAGAFFGTRELLQWGDAKERTEANDVANLRGSAGRSSMSLRANDTAVMPDALRELVQLNKLSSLNGFAVDAGGIKESRDNLLDALMKHGGSSGMLRAIGLGSSEAESVGPTDESKIAEAIKSANADQANAIKSAMSAAFSGTLSVNVVNMPAGGMGGDGRVPGAPT